MGIFDRFPYSSTHEMNLDFMLGKATEIAESLQEVQDGLSDIDTHKAQAEQAAQAAQASQAAASASAGQAAQHKTDAEDAADRAEAASTEAETAADRAEEALGNMTDSETVCMNAADRAEAAQAAVAADAQAASSSAANASRDAGQAATSAGSAANSATDAANSANSANVSATNASLHATNASTSATNAATSATNAATSATNAATSAAGIQDAADHVESLVASLPEDFTDLNNEVTDLKSAVDEVESIYDVVIGKNLIDPSKLEVGILTYTGAVNASNTDYTTSGFIPVDVATNYFASCIVNGSLSKTRYLSACYNSAKEFISGTLQNVDNTSGLLVTTPNSDAKFVKVSAHFTKGGGADFQLEKGSAYTTFEAYTEIKKLKIYLGDTPVEQIGPIVDDEADELLEKYNVPILQTAQLFDRSMVEVGFCNIYGYINTSSTGYVHTQKFPVTAGKTIYFSSNGIAKVARYVTAFNSLGEVVSESGDDNGSATPRAYLVPSGITAVIVTYVNPSSDATFSNFQAEYDHITGCAPYGKYFNIDDYLEKNNILYGKKWAVCGDSFTAGVTNNKMPSGRYEGKNKVYPYFIGNRNNMDILKFFEGGRTLAFPAEPGTFTNSLTNPNADWYYQNIPADVDYITIYLGINDEHHSPGSSGGDGEDNTGEIPIGTINDNTTATYLGAWNVVLTWLITNRPNAHIGIIVTNGNQSKDEYRQGQIAIAEKYGMPYIDLNGDARTPAMLRTSNPNIASAVKTALIEKWRVSAENTHPNDAAHEFESTFIENFLRSI